MKECPNCKSVMDDDALFCGVCGTKFEIEKTEAQDEETIVTEEKYCIHCGKAIEVDSAFCPFCGKPQDVEEIKEEPQQETVEQESLQEPEEEVPQQEPVESEHVQADEQSPVPLPQPESSEQLEQSKQSEQPEKSEADDQSTYEREEEKRPHKWLWILLALLIAGVAGWFFFIQDSENTPYEPQVDTDTIEEIADSVYDDEAMDDGMSTDEQDFLKNFYRGEYINEEYVSRNVTSYVLNKLKRDAEMDGQSGRLAVWVFDAYITGTDDADHEYEKGPLILQTDEADKFCIIYQFNYYDEPPLCRARKVYLTVSKEDGKFLISDYEVENNGNGDEQEINTSSEGITSEMKSSSANIEKREHSSVDDNYVYDQVDQMPQFPGGPAAMFEYLSKNIRYPAVAEENGVQGKVIVTFIVERDGSISNVKVVKSVDPSLNNEASRIVRSMPHWIPGKQNGTNVRVKYTVPVDFKLQ